MDEFTSPEIIKELNRIQGIEIDRHRSPAYTFASATAFEQADREGLQVVLPTPYQLFIDIDSDEMYAEYKKRLLQAEKHYHMSHVQIAPSKSGLPNRHITITLGGKVEPMERLLLQLFLGSDPTREFLGLQRIKHDDPHPTLFLETK